MEGLSPFVFAWLRLGWFGSVVLYCFVLFGCFFVCLFCWVCLGSVSGLVVFYLSCFLSCFFCVCVIFLCFGVIYAASIESVSF